MFIGDILVAHGLVTPADIRTALELQRTRGGALGDCLIQLERLTPEALEAVMRAAPPPPRSLAETGIPIPDLLSLMVKAMHASGEVTASAIGERLKLPPRAVQELFDEAEERRLLDLLGAVRQSGSTEIRYALTDKGVQWARTASDQNEYIGPAPVTLAAYREQILRQRLANERVTRARLDEALTGLVVPDVLVRELGPAVNSGRSVLLYGPPGNGKTTIGERIGNLFRDVIYIPYCFEVEGQIIRVFDPVVHRPLESQLQGDVEAVGLRREDLDHRWVACWRPLVITGGELTLDMLDLKFDPHAKFYEAPLHIRALGGVFLIDDFGRQLVSPTALLNRWIVPLESRVEYLKLHTGKTFQLPFDELVIFSTNLGPSSLMDPAFLRRIPYKIEVTAPTAEEYRSIFHAVARPIGLALDDATIDGVIAELRVRNDFPLASYQPRFIVDQILAQAKFEGAEAEARADYVSLALSNLHTSDTPGFRHRPAANGPDGGGEARLDTVTSFAAE